jgi:hypothetical protein
MVVLVGEVDCGVVWLTVVGVLLACNTVQGGKKKSKMIKETFNALQQFIPSLVYEPSLISF